MSQPEEPPPPPPAVELQPDNQQPSVPYQSDSTPPDYPPPPVPELLYDDVVEDQIYDEPIPDLSAGPQPETNLNMLSPVNVVPYSGGYPVSNYLPNVISKPTGPPPPPPPAGLQPQYQPSPGYPVAQPGQSISTYPVRGQEVPGVASLAAGFQPNNQPPPVQPVIIQSSNPAPQQVQPYSAPAVPPMISTGLPPGLDYLNQVDQVLIHQKIECVKILTGFEPSNQYEIKNSTGQTVYHVKEESDCFARSVLGPIRNFRMRVEDNMGQEIMRMERQLRCFPQEIEVQAPPGIIIGYVRQEWSFLFPTFCVVGPNNEVLLKIQGPFLSCDYCSDINYEVKALVGGKSIGVIIKQQTDFITKCFNDASNFCVQFPLDLDVKIKALLLGACLFMDILFFDKSGTLFIKLFRGLI